MTGQEKVDEFNRENPVGASVIVRRDDGLRVLTTVRDRAIVLPSGAPVVWLKGVSGCYLLDRVRPVNQHNNVEAMPDAIRLHLLECEACFVYFCEGARATLASEGLIIPVTEDEVAAAEGAMKSDAR